MSFYNTYKKYNAMVEILDHTPSDYQEAMAVAKRGDKLPIGVIYKTQKSPFHKELYGDWNPVLKRISKEERRKRISNVLQPR